MDRMLPSVLGKLKIICSLPLFSDSICIKKQSAAEHGYTQVILSMILGSHLGLSESQQCDLLELTIFAELPKAFLGDPSFYLRQRHPDVKRVYDRVRRRLWKETEESLGVQTTRDSRLSGLHQLTDAFAAMLYVEKERLLGNQFFAAERFKTFYDQKRKQAFRDESLSKKHPCASEEEHMAQEKKWENENGQNVWKRAVLLLDEIYEEASKALLEGGIPEYSATFLGMVEKLKEQFRYKGWSYHYKESVGEHTFQVVFLSFVVASRLNLSDAQRCDLYRLAALHDLAEAYAGDIIFPVKMREKDMGALHHQLEEDVIQGVCQRFGIRRSEDPFLCAIVEICDKFSAKLYFDREQRSGNTLFQVPNISMDKVREKFSLLYPEVFAVLDALWLEYVSTFSADPVAEFS